MFTGNQGYYFIPPTPVHGSLAFASAKPEWPTIAKIGAKTLRKWSSLAYIIHLFQAMCISDNTCDISSGGHLKLQIENKNVKAGKITLSQALF